MIVIDDINRCNINAVLGDVLTALESSEVSNVIKTDKGDLKIPENLFMIATMNPLIGKEAIDYAWFRRFTLVELKKLMMPGTNGSSACSFNIDAKEYFLRKNYDEPDFILFKAREDKTVEFYQDEFASNQALFMRWITKDEFDIYLNKRKKWD